MTGEEVFNDLLSRCRIGPQWALKLNEWPQLNSYRAAGVHDDLHGNVADLQLHRKLWILKVCPGTRTTGQLEATKWVHAIARRTTYHAAKLRPRMATSKCDWQWLTSRDDNWIVLSMTFLGYCRLLAFRQAASRIRLVICCLAAWLRREAKLVCPLFSKQD